MKHKHSEIIKAWLDGAECEFLNSYKNEWDSIDFLYEFSDWDNVRIKPEPQYQEPQYLYVYNDERECKTWMSPELIRYTDGWVYIGKVKVEK